MQKFSAHLAFIALLSTERTAFMLPSVCSNEVPSEAFLLDNCVFKRLGGEKNKEMASSSFISVLFELNNSTKLI
jgi:hypothetical protein